MAPLQAMGAGQYLFNGYFTESQRDSEYGGTAEATRCGFMAPSGFDVLRDFDGFQKCKVVVVNLVAQGRDVLLQPQHVGAHNLMDGRLCMISIMDINGVLRGCFCGISDERNLISFA
jgi:hypothetical protein